MLYFFEFYRKKSFEIISKSSSIDECLKTIIRIYSMLK